MDGSIREPAALARAMRDLGAPREAGRALVLGGDSLELARALKTALKPRAVIVRHDGPRPARSRLELVQGDLPQLAATDAAPFDLILAVDALDGALGAVAARVRALRDLLAPGGVALLALDTLGAPPRGEGAGPHDLILFPECAAAGELGEAEAVRIPLPASAWRLLLEAAGLTVLAAHGQDASPPEHVRIDHAPRLALYDAGELAAGAMLFLVQRGEGA